RGGTRVGTVGGTTLSYSDTTVAPSTTYSYTVDAFDAAGNHSAPSAAASVTTPAATDTQAPSVPTGLAGSAPSANQVNLSWSASTDSVPARRSTDHRGGTRVGTVGGTTLSY